MAGLDVSESLYRDLSGKMQRTANSILSLQAAILKWMKENQERTSRINDGLGATSFQNLCDSIDKKHGEQISYCEVSKEVYDDMCKTGVLQSGKLRTYSAMQATNSSDRVMIFYGSKDQQGMNDILDTMDAMYGKRAELTKEAFGMVSEGKDVFVLDGVSPQDVELLSHITEMTNKDGEKEMAFPFTVVQLDDKNKYKLTVICLDEDKEKLSHVMSLVAGAYTSVQSDRVLEQVEYKIKGRQERNIAIDEAKKEATIVDADNPQNMVHVTAKDYVFYKNNKEVETIPRNGPLNRVYDIIEGMSSPVMVDDKKYMRLSGSEQQEVLHNSSTPIEKVSDRIINVNMKEAEDMLQYQDTIKKYLDKFSYTTIKDDGRDIDSIMKDVEKQQKQRAKQEARNKDPEYDER